MRTLRNNIPNGFTISNLICGIISIAFTMDNELIIYSPYLIFIGGLFDFMDGMAARLLKAYSDLGKQLDSLADLVTFGVAPSILAFIVLKNNFIVENIAATSGFSISQYIILAISLTFPVFSAIRLAKFNIDTTQTDSFKGVPTPASAFLVSSVVLAYLSTDKSFVGNIVEVPWLFASILTIICILMVSNIPMLSLKFKNFIFIKNYERYLLIFVSIILIAILGFDALAVIILFYILLSISTNLLKKKTSE